MSYRRPLVTTAALIAIAIAALSGALLPYDRFAHADPPAFNTGGGTRSIAENTPPGVNIGDPISATDPDDDGLNNNDLEYGDTLTYSLGGTDAASFDIDSSTGQLITKAALDYEKPHGGTDSDSNAYMVTVTVKDSDGNSPDAQAVTINVTNVAEAPGALAAPTVVSTDSDDNAATYELKVVWYAPDDGGDGVTGYDVQYKETTAAGFTDHTHDATTSTNIADLDVDTSYQVRVRATNGVGKGPWSLSSTGKTNKKDNALPEFTDGDAVTRNVLENAEAGLVVGTKVSATDDDNVLPLAYTLHGPDANSFDLQASTGQIRTKRGVVYDYETKPTLYVTMTVSDGQGGTDAIAVTISITDEPEAPSKPARPTVRATAKSSRSLDVSWTEPDNTGPAITGYDVRYRKGNSGNFRKVELTSTGTTHTIAPEDDGNTNDVDERLTPGASYEVYVRAKNGESPSQWSDAGTGRTSAGNSEPVFDDRDSVTRDNQGNLPAYTTKRTVAENTRAGQSVGKAVRANDGNGDKRTYRLVAAASPNDAHVDKFDINKSTGQILTKEPLNHEAECSTGDGSLTGGHPENCTYTVKVQVWDGRDEHRNEQDTSTITDAIIDDEITVEITVSDVTEKPAAPAVTVTSPDTSNSTTLVVTWTAPDNTGPVITGYRLECTGTDVPETQCPKDDIADTAVTHTITGLTANKSYRVRLRAKNAEGDGAWSSWVTQSTNKDGNNPPTFDNPPAELYVKEEAPSAQQSLTTDSAGQTVAALQVNDADSDTMTLRLEGPGAGRFSIDNVTGAIKTKSKLNHEASECGYDNTDTTTSCTYKVRVKLSDTNGGSTFHALTIKVTDVEEAPEKPAAPRVTATSGSGWSLEVTWNAPSNDGPPITGYQIRYRETGDNTAVWQQWTHAGTGRSAKIITILTDLSDTNTAVHLDPSTQYEVQVRALNGEGDSTFGDATNWSTSGKGTTGASNIRPAFKSTVSVVELEVEENTRSGQNVGSAVEATDEDKHRLTYTLEGPNKDSFSITSGGQIRTRASLNHEERDKYSLTVKVNDGQKKNNSVAAKSVTIEVTDRPEAPSKPKAPTVSGIPGSTDSVRVTWEEPANAGPPITHYSVQYADSGSGAFTRVEVPTGSADRSVVITGLTAGTRYDVQVRAQTPELASDWSSSGTGSPNPDQANRNPAFSGGSRSFSVAENTAPGADVGDLVAALDQDGDTLTYSLEGVDADSFDIIVTNAAGQIQTKAALNHEDKASYSVAVRTRDGRGGTAAVNVTIRVTDVDGEAPDTPFAPVVTAISSTSIQVNWDEPANEGPPINDYDYRYKAFGDTDWTEASNTTISARTVTIDGLTASTSYDVEVRAKNAEGASEWSNPGNGATNAPGANNLPVFSDGTSATRSVSAAAATGTSIGDPVAATDADTADTITYSIEGRDAASFAINEKTGQILTKSGVTLIIGETYTVTVAADDTKDTTKIPVSIQATAEPPNNLPVFSEGASASRSVLETAAVGTSLGSAVRATDADTGDTLTYTLSGTDAASFRINSANGQLSTGVALDADVKASYSVSVNASDGKATATIAVTVTVTPVTTFGCATKGAVPDAAANPGLVADCEALLQARSRLEGGARLLSWSEYIPVNNWNGVTVRGTPARVTRIILRGGRAELYSGKLQGTIPAELGDLSMLTELNLHSNQLTGTIPAELNGLSRLEKLLIHNNRLSGTIPNLSGLTNLKMLWLSGKEMNLSGGIPAWLNGMSGLESLSLWGNKLSGRIPPLTGMTSLSLLKIQSNNLTGGIPSWFGQMQSVRGLYIHLNPLGGTIPPELGNLTRLRRMWLHSSNLTGTIPVELANMTNLATLNLRNNQLTGPIPAAIGSMTELQQLLLHNNQLTGAIPASLGSLSNLRQLAASNNLLAGAIPSELGGLDRLTLLWLSENQLSGTIPAQLGDLGDTLTKIRLADNSFADTACLPAGIASVANNDYADAGLAACP